MARMFKKKQKKKHIAAHVAASCGIKKTANKIIIEKHHWDLLLWIQIDGSTLMSSFKLITEWMVNVGANYIKIKT